MVKEPNQAIYDACYDLCNQLGYDTYDYLPHKVAYPFVYLGDQQGIASETKELFNKIGMSHLTFHIFNKADSRSETTDMSMRLIDQCKRLRRSNIYNIVFVSSDQHIFLDTTTEQPLIHIAVNVEFQYSGVESDDRSRI